MKFGEKVRLLRTKNGLSQTELGELCGLSLRTIRNYEVDGRYPKQREVYTKLANALNCNVNYLLSEDEGFVLHVQQGHGRQGVKHIEQSVSDIFALFAGSKISEQDKDAVMRALQDAYRMAKKRSKGKYTQKKDKESLDFK